MLEHQDLEGSIAGDLESTDSLRILIIGAGSRGCAYARAVCNGSNGIVVAVAEPAKDKRLQLGRKYIWGNGEPTEDQVFDGWREFVEWEKERRQKAAKGDLVVKGVDGVFICTLDETHAEIALTLAPLGLHILCEKPLATTLKDCIDIYKALLPTSNPQDAQAIFAIGHVLRYSPHNMLMRRLLLEEKVIGDIISIEHTEPVGWWHFSHSYVRGNWRKESKTAPSLLTKSCHDIDLLLWILCAGPSGSNEPPHLPSTISSTGSLVYFTPRRKPKLAGTATNCLSCKAESECMYSAKKIYLQSLRSGNTGWPVKIVLPEIEECIEREGWKAGEKALLNRLAEDYDKETPNEERDGRPWFGRCVYEAENDVCDDQFVTITWDDKVYLEDSSNDNSIQTESRESPNRQRSAKRAMFHMVAFTEKICERRSRIYGTRGEMEADSRTIRVYDFASNQSSTYHPQLRGGGHGGGDDGLVRQFLLAIDAVKNGGSSVADAQKAHVGCTLEDIIRSHAMVFAAEDARTGNRIVDWGEWWTAEVQNRLRSL